MTDYTTLRRSLHRTINARGVNEQEKQYLFSALYGNKAVTRLTIGMYTEFDNNLKRKNDGKQNSKTKARG